MNEPPFEPHSRVRTTVWDPDLPEGAEGVVQGCDRVDRPAGDPDWDVYVKMADGQIWNIDWSILEAVRS